MGRGHNELPKNLVKRLTALRRVLVTNLDPGLSFKSRGKVTSPGDLVARIDAFFAVCDAVPQAQLAWQRSLIERTKATPGASSLADECKVYATTVLGREHPAINQRFLRGPGGQHEIDTLTHVKAAAKRRATRKRRKTMGKRQRAKLKAYLTRARKPLPFSPGCAKVRPRRGYPRDPEAVAAPLPVPDGRSGGGDRARDSDQGLQERLRQ